MDVGASVAFVSEPPARGAMDQPPRDPARRFLDDTQLSAIALTAVALTVAVLPTFLLVQARWGTDMAIAAAVAGWLVANVAIAWTLRARPGLAWRSNVAFPAWALIAVASAVVLSFTAAGPRSASTRSAPGRPPSPSASRRLGSPSPSQDGPRCHSPGVSDPRCVLHQRRVFGARPCR